MGSCKPTKVYSPRNEPMGSCKPTKVCSPTDRFLASAKTERRAMVCFKCLRKGPGGPTADLPFSSGGSVVSKVTK
ncbi:hypothetical protein Ddc_24953 [Ditylenchus destructor]|nr:hypothetical protein Ddc_24953 [Ditylenchus destructor]